MSDEKPGCLGWFMALFGIKPRHAAKEEPAAKVQTDSGQVASVLQTEQTAPALELHQQKPPPSVTIETFPYKVTRSLLQPSELVFGVGA